MTERERLEMAAAMGRQAFADGIPCSAQDAAFTPLLKGNIKDVIARMDAWRDAWFAAYWADQSAPASFAEG